MILCLVGFAVYANTLWNGFVYDDHSQVLRNPYLRSFRYLPEIFTSNVWSFIGAQGESNYFRPIMTLGYFFCYQIYGELAYGFHLFNILVHLGVLLALFFVTLRLFGRRDMALGACFLFALHPVHTESVAWIAAVTELELALFYLLTFYFFSVWVTRTQKNETGIYWGWSVATRRGFFEGAGFNVAVAGRRL